MLTLALSKIDNLVISSKKYDLKKGDLDTKTVKKGKLILPAAGVPMLHLRPQGANLRS
jgi:hypothetical protein